jgi:hypothetical protein
VTVAIYESPSGSLDSYFINYRVLLSLLPNSQAEEVSRGMAAIGDDDGLNRARISSMLNHAMRTYLDEHQVPSVAIAHGSGSLRHGDIVWLEQSLTWKGVPRAAIAHQAGDEAASGAVSGRLDTAPDVRLHAGVPARHLRNVTARSRLYSTSAPLFILARIHRVDAHVIELSLIVVAERVHDPQSGFPTLERSFAEVHPEQIDEFSRARVARFDQSWKALRTIPEAEVKAKFAAILGEPFVHPDWGGEQHDLFTSRLHLSGAPTTAAFVLKGGRGGWGPMTIAKLGKNGDQIDRLAEGPSEIVVVQHCHEIPARVRNMLRVYATAYRKRWCAIDGPTTWAILDAYK